MLITEEFEEWRGDQANGSHLLRQLMEYVHIAHGMLELTCDVHMTVMVFSTLPVLHPSHKLSSHIRT